MKNIYIDPIFDVISLVSCAITTSGVPGGGVGNPSGNDDEGFRDGDW